VLLLEPRKPEDIATVEAEAADDNANGGAAEVSTNGGADDNANGGAWIAGWDDVSLTMVLFATTAEVDIAMLEAGGMGMTNALECTETDETACWANEAKVEEASILWLDAMTWLADKTISVVFAWAAGACVTVAVCVSVKVTYTVEPVLHGEFVSITTTVDARYALELIWTAFVLAAKAAVVLAAIVDVAWTVEFEPSIAPDGSGVAVALPPVLTVIGGKDFAASTHAVTRGKTVEKMFASRLTSPKGGGKSGRFSPNPTSTVTDTLASTSTSGPRARRSVLIPVVVFRYGALGVVALLLLPQLATAFVDSFASRRGRFIDTKTSAFSLSKNSNPTGIVGLNASPSSMSTSVMFTLKGNGVSLEPGKPVMPLWAMFVSSSRATELSGICIS
jgi:hypothetical protein